MALAVTMGVGGYLQLSWERTGHGWISLLRTGLAVSRYQMYISYVYISISNFTVYSIILPTWKKAIHSSLFLPLDMTLWVQSQGEDSLKKHLIGTAEGAQYLPQIGHSLEN
jgi:hypothetical protein